MPSHLLRTWTVALALALGWSATLDRSQAADTQSPATRGDVLKTLRKTHPRLLVSSDDFERVAKQVQTNTTLKAWYADLRKEADKLLEEEPLAYRIPDGKRLLSVSRGVLYRVYTLALVYRVDNQAAHRDRAWAELNNAAGFKDWNPSHFLDTAEMTHAFAIGYDWLFDAWTSAQRKRIREAIVRLGLTPGINSYNGKQRYGWWTSAKHNWNQVCNGGLTLGALAIADEEPELARSIIGSALKSIPRAMKEYEPDGGYKEGPAYWTYGTGYNIYMMAGLQTALGSDLGLAAGRGFDITGDFPVHMASPANRMFNFADCKDREPTRTPTLFWLAKRFDRPIYAWYQKQHAKPTALDILWYQPVPASYKVSNEPRIGYWVGPQAITMRSSWQDSDATFVGFKAGQPRDNHAQADLGSFVLDRFGVRWAIDLGPDNYNLPGYFDRNRRRWYFYRNRAEGHNTLVLKSRDPKADLTEFDQAVKAHANIIAQGQRSGYLFAVANLDTAYPTSAQSVRRGVVMSPGGDVLVQDEISAKSRWGQLGNAGLPIWVGQSFNGMMAAGFCPVVASMFAMKATITRVVPLA